MRPAPRGAAAFTTVVTVVVAGLVAAAPTYAAPVPVEDRAAVYASGTYTLDVLANDGTAAEGAGEVTLCGVSGVDQQVLYVEEVGDELVVEVVDRFAGTTRFAYDVCQDGARESAAVVLTVTRLRDVTAVKKPRTRGKVRFSNPNAVPVRVLWGRASGGRPDASRSVGAGRTVTISTSRRAIFWLARYLHGPVVIVVGDGTVSRLRTTR